MNREEFHSHLLVSRSQDQVTQDTGPQLVCWVYTKRPVPKQNPWLTQQGDTQIP